jgi:hypothetical protein
LVALRKALEAVRLLDEASARDESNGAGRTRELYAQIVAGHPYLLARLIGERQLLMEGLVGLIALRMSVDPDTDIRPRLLVHAVDAAISAAWFTGFANPGLDRWVLLEEAFEILESGMADGSPSVGSSIPLTVPPARTTGRQGAAPAARARHATAH